MSTNASVAFSAPLFAGRKSSPSEENSQWRLLQGGMRQNISLRQCLEKAGLTIEDLCYVTNPVPPTTPLEAKVSLPASSSRVAGLPTISFFSGAGGMDIGLESAGFKHLALFENNPIFCRTLRENRPKWNIVGPPDDLGDVSKTDEIIALLEKRFSVRPAFEGVFVGGPPCQPFSVAANQRFNKNGDNFKRTGFLHKSNGGLLFKFGALIAHFKPKVFLVENVPGLLDIDAGEQLSNFCNTAAKNGYRVHSPTKLKAENFGVPQFRERLFIVGFRGDKAWTPPPAASRRVACGEVLTPNVALYANHQTREHRIESVLRYRVLDFGKRDSLGRVDRLDPFLPSKTVIAGGLLGGGRSHLHPWIPRTLSVRECARLQTFPDNYVFVGPMARQFTQVGNAVPPLLARALAKSIYDSFVRKKRAQRN